MAILTDIANIMSAGVATQGVVVRMKLAEHFRQDIIPGHGVSETRGIQKTGVERCDRCQHAHEHEKRYARQAEKVSAQKDMRDCRSAHALLGGESDPQGNGKQRIDNGKDSDGNQHALADEPVILCLLGKRCSHSKPTKRNTPTPAAWIIFESVNFGLARAGVKSIPIFEMA